MITVTLPYITMPHYHTAPSYYQTDYNWSINGCLLYVHRAAKKKKKADKDAKDEKGKDGKDNKQAAGAKGKGAAAAGDKAANAKGQAGAKAHEDGRPESHMTHGSGEENDKYVTHLL